MAANKPISEVVAKSGSRSKLVLPDGTQVWLNGESRLSYQPSFNTDKREVNLEGEAFLM
nr:FecR domain-containing protein [Paraflavitalea speifideiaquila]